MQLSFDVILFWRTGGGGLPFAEREAGKVVEGSSPHSTSQKWSPPEGMSEQRRHLEPTFIKLYKIHHKGIMNTSAQYLSYMRELTLLVMLHQSHSLGHWIIGAYDIEEEPMGYCGKRPEIRKRRSCSKTYLSKAAGAAYV